MSVKTGRRRGVKMTRAEVATLPPHARLIREGAQARGMTSRDLAAKTGLSANTVCRVWNGSAQVSLEQLTKVADAVGVIVEINARPDPASPTQVVATAGMFTVTVTSEDAV